MSAKLTEQASKGLATAPVYLLVRSGWESAPRLPAFLVPRPDCIARSGKDYRRVRELAWLPHSLQYPKIRSQTRLMTLATGPGDPLAEGETSATGSSSQSGMV